MSTPNKRLMGGLEGITYVDNDLKGIDFADSVVNRLLPLWERYSRVKLSASAEMILGDIKSTLEDALVVYLTPSEIVSLSRRTKIDGTYLDDLSPMLSEAKYSFNEAGALAKSLGLDIGKGEYRRLLKRRVNELYRIADRLKGVEGAHELRKKALGIAYSLAEKYNVGNSKK